MDWADVPYFLAVAEHRSLAAAARQLEVDHSTVFRRLNGLERRLGVRVFERGAEGYALTRAGEQILPLVQEAEQALLAVERTVAGRNFRLTGPLRVSAPTDLASRYLAPCAAAFQREHPGIRVEISVSEDASDVVRREADVALQAGSPPPPHLAATLAVSIPWYAMAGKRYLRQHARPEKMTDLAQHRLIGGSAALRRLSPFDWLDRNFLPEQFTCRAGDLGTVTSLAAAGMGVAFLPGDRADPEVVELFELQPPFSTELWILTHPDQQRAVRPASFAEFLRSALRGHPALKAFVR
jgi:DNA-binding transcriptional LysR family regulator